MDLIDVLRLYDRDERQQTEVPGMRCEAASGVVRLVDTVSSHSTVIYSCLTEDDADRVIQREALYFKQLGHTVEWKLFSHDAPANLHERLLSHGFSAEDPESIMVLDLGQAPASLLSEVPLDIRRVTDPDGLEDVARVWTTSDYREALLDQIGHLLRHHEEYLSVYVAYDNGVPVSTARIHFPHQSAFASLWGGETIVSHRKRGYYTALLAVRVQEAIRRGARFLTIDAGPMSRPIVEQHGFQLLTSSQPHVLSSED
jgi:hypothetical protein